MIGWITAGDDWIKKRNAFIDPQLGADPSQQYSQEYLQNNPDLMVQVGNQQGDWQKKWDALQEQWFASLPPEEAQKAHAAFAERSANFDKQNKIGRAIALGVIGAAAGGAGLQALGGAGLSGGAGTAATVPSQALQGGSMLSGSGMTSAGQTVGSGLLGGAGGAGSSNGSWDVPGNTGGSNGSWDVPGNVGNGGSSGLELNMKPFDPALPMTPGVTPPTVPPSLGLPPLAAIPGAGALLPGGGSAPGGGSTPSLPGGGSGGGLLDGIGNLVPGNAKDWLTAITGGAGLINSMRPPEMPDTPDYMALAKQQAELQQQLLNQQTLANRSNQSNAQGDTSSWVQDPATGQWTQKQTFGGSNQQLFDQQQAQKSGLLNLMGQNPQSNPNWKPFDMSASGNDKAIQDAWMARIAPARQISRNAEIQRLTNQGLTEGTPGWNAAMERLNRADTDAYNQAAIYGAQEYGNEYNRGLNANQVGFNQNQTTAMNPYNMYGSLNANTVGNPIFGNQANSGMGVAPDLSGAAQNQYNASIGNANQQNAYRNNISQGLMGLAGNFAKGGWGTS